MATIGIVGARGVVGAQLVSALQRRGVQAEQVKLFATDVEGVDYDGDELTCETVDPQAFNGLKVVILATPSTVAHELSKVAQQQGIWAIDLSGSHRLNEAVPLVAPGVNNAVVDRPFKGKIVSIASPESIALSQILMTLNGAFGVLAMDCSAVLSASHLGKTGVEKLSSQSASLLNGVESDADPFPHRLAFNVASGFGQFEQGLSESERRILVEMVRIFGSTKPPALTCTALLAPCFHGSVMSLTVMLERPTNLEAVREIFKKEQAYKVIDDVAAHVYPLSLLTHDDSTVHVGRIRVVGQRLQLVCAIDNAFLFADRALDTALEIVERD